MTLAKEDIPKSLIATKKIIERKPNTARKEDTDFRLKKSGSAKVLVDISATLTTPGEDKSIKFEVRFSTRFLIFSPVTIILNSVFWIAFL